MSETFLPDGATDLPADRDMTFCPFGCGAKARHNQSIYLWDCQSNSLRLVSEPVGHPIPGDLIQTSTCRTRKELATLRAQLADSQRLRAEAERERDEAIGHNHFCPTCKMFCKECQCVEAKLFGSARLLTAATARADALEEAAREVVRWYYEDCVSSTWPGETTEMFGALRTALLAPAEEVRDGK